METHYPFSQARKDFSTLYDRVEGGSIAVVRRRGSRPVALVDAEEQARLLSEHFPFEVQVRIGERSVAMWVENIPVHAQADDLDAATRALARELIEYADDWESELRFAPNHKDAWGYVRRIQIAGGAEAVEAMVIADAEATASSAE